jgi:hypothetical protein
MKRVGWFKLFSFWINPVYKNMSMKIVQSAGFSERKQRMPLRGITGLNKIYHRRMPSYWDVRRVDLVWTDVSEERIAFIFRV